MEDFIKNGDQLREFFYKCSINPKKDELLKTFIYVRSKIRADVLCDVDQGRITLNGIPMKFHFTHINGGIWMASVRKL